MSGQLTVDYDVLKRIVFDLTGLRAVAIDFLTRDETRRKFEVTLENAVILIYDTFGAHIPPYVVNSEVAVMRFVRDHTSIPVSRVLAFETDISHPLGAFILTKRLPGPFLDAVFPLLSSDQQDLIATNIAQWAAELSKIHFPRIGSLYPGREEGYIVGPIVHDRFFSEGRARLSIDRGPFKSAREYLLACTQREIDCARMLGAQDASSEYRRDLEECRLQVEHSMALMEELIRKCQGLDEDDMEMATFSLDFHNIRLKDFVVVKDDPTHIISVGGWHCASTMPLWQCGRLPRWLAYSMVDDDSGLKVRLAAIYRHAIIKEDGENSLLLRALDDEGSTRCSLHDLCDYDAFKDGFLLRPTLESIAATLPGNEDMEGLSAILDPSTVTGRVARISLLTSGSAGDALSLAFSEMSMTEKIRPRVEEAS